MKPGDDQISVDEQGRLVISPALAERLGLVPGAQTRAVFDGESLKILRPVDHLVQVYIEPTNACNLDCRTCVRNVWEEPRGWMSEQVFERVLEGLKSFSPIPAVFFGGFGEPLTHPHILDMIQRVKGLGARVEMITNGVLLDETKARALIELGLDRLWVSIDGASPDSYADVRLGAELAGVIANLERLRDLRQRVYSESPEMGIAFVAMRRNLKDLPEVLHIGNRLGVRRFVVTNVLAYTAELRKEALYDRRMYDASALPPRRIPEVGLPRMDYSPDVLDVIQTLLSEELLIHWDAGSPQPGVNRCPFVQKGSLSVRWDGRVSPCLPLLYGHVSWLDDHERRSVPYAVGSLVENSLPDLWHDPAYAALRQRLADFDFSPCTYCNTCEMAESNQEDCFGSSFPACGGCLWAQGIIRCP